MGSSIALQAVEKGIEVFGFSKEVLYSDELIQKGVQVLPHVRQMTQKMRAPRVIFIYLPAGPTVDFVIDSTVASLSAGDVLVDAGNSHFRDSIVRQQRLSQLSLGFVDCGSSGGPEGARHGACFMAGGSATDVAKVEIILRTLAVPNGFVHAGPPGAGHFAKLIHNAIEFGMLQSIGEGLAMMKASQFKFDLPAIFHNWAHGSVIRGWLVELMERGLRQNPDLNRIPSHVEDTGEVNWAIEEALKLEVPIPAVTAAVNELFASRDRVKAAQRSIAILRHEMGGHPFGKDEAIAQERQTGKVGLVSDPVKKGAA